MVLKKDGSLWVTGENHKGQLGDGSNTDKNEFEKILNDNKNRFVKTIGTWDTPLGNTLSTCSKR